MSLQKVSVFSSIKKLYRIFNKKQKKTFAWLAVLTFVSSVTDLFGLLLIVPVVSLVLSPTSYHSLTHALPILAHFSKEQLLLLSVGFFFFLILGKNAFGLYVNKLQVNFVRDLYVSSTMNVLEKVYDRSMLDIQKETSNEIVNKLTTLQINLSSNAAISTIILINEGIVFGLTAITLLCWNWQLFILLIGVVLPVIGFFFSRVKGMIQHAGREKSKNIIDLYAKGQEMIFGYADIKIAGTEKTFKKRFENTARKYSVLQGKMDFMQFIPTRILEIAIFLCFILIMLYGVYVLKDPDKIVATLSIFALMAGRSLPSVNRFVVAMNNLNGAEFVFNDPDFVYEEKIEKQTNTANHISFNNSIKFDDVFYRYSDDSKYVIQDCNLEIKKGDKVGIIGKSGSGKSTLIANILGFLAPSKGKIYIDQTALNPDNLKDWWKIVGYVRQEVFIMNTTFIENIAIGEDTDKIDIERVKRAVQLASLNELVAEWPEGLYTPLKERGNNLSGGQKQRISIARAIYKGAQILIFDEATSALDTKTEEEITNSIQQLGHEDLTIIIIAHRYTSLKYCNKIYMLDNGRVGNCFSYDELAMSVQ